MASIIPHPTDERFQQLGVELDRRQGKLVAAVVENKALASKLSDRITQAKAREQKLEESLAMIGIITTGMNDSPILDRALTIALDSSDEILDAINSNTAIIAELEADLIENHGWLI